MTEPTNPSPAGEPTPDETFTWTGDPGTAEGGPWRIRPRGIRRLGRLRREWRRDHRDGHPRLDP